MVSSVNQGQNIDFPHSFAAANGKIRQLTVISDTFPSPFPGARKMTQKCPAGPAGRALHSLVLFSDVEPEQDHISVLDDIFLSLDPYESLLAGCRQGAEFQKHFIIDDFGLDKAPLEI